MGLTIVQMTQADVAEVTELNKLCFTCPWSAESLMAETKKPDAIFVVARAEDGSICGYAGFNYVLDEGYIANIAVHPTVRRQGVGRLLLQELTAQAQALNLSFLTLEVRVSNTAAQRLYGSLGFTEAGRRKNFYEAIREDAIIMTKYFKGEQLVKTRIEAVIFDMDGLMLDTERIYDFTSRQAAIDMGYMPNPELSARTMGVTSAAWRGVIKELYGEDFPIDEFEKRGIQLMDEEYEKNGVPIKTGLVELLKYLQHENIPSVVASSTYTEKGMKMLRGAGVDGYFADFVFGDMVAKSKPEPDIFLAAAKALGKTPESCMGLEDSYNGLMAAKSAGLYTVMVPDMLIPDDALLSMIDDCLPSLHDVIKLIDKLNHTPHKEA